MQTLKLSTEYLSQQIREIVSEELEIELSELDDRANLIDEYDADSLSLITVAARIDKELGISLPPEIQPDLVDVQSVVAAALAIAGELGES